MRFCSVINCLDGRAQLPVIYYLQKRFQVDYVDSITEAGPNKILSEEENTAALQMILDKLTISVEKHHSVGIAVAGHHDCAGNPTSPEIQIKQIEKAVNLLRQHHGNKEIIGLWVDDSWKVQEIGKEEGSGS